MSLSQNSAETVGVQALAWLVGNEELLPVFLGASGAAIDDLRKQVADPAFLASVLDFILMNDDWVIGFCDAQGLGYDTPMRARAAMPGGEQVSWT